MKFHCFIISKPLQYLNVLNIDVTGEKILLIINSFLNAHEFSDKVIKNNVHWNRVLNFGDTASALEWLIQNKFIVEDIYIDSDIGNVKQFRSLKDVSIYLYEEGVGTYRRTMYKPRTWIGRLLFGLRYYLGFQNRRGGSGFVDAIIVYNVSALKELWSGKRRPKVVSFRHSFIGNLRIHKNEDVFRHSFPFDRVVNLRVALYLTSWKINKRAEDAIKSLDVDFVIIKPHPHIKDLSGIKVHCDFLFTSNVPSEILIYDLLNYTKDLFVVSEYSSSIIPFVNSQGFHAVNIELLENSGHNDWLSYIEAFEVLIKP